jgi:drug/metabolite transporter (DMT)-like permease
VRIFLLTALTMVAFSANSLLTRGALGAGHIDAPAFTIVRLATGALALAILLRMRSGGLKPAIHSSSGGYDGERGSWSSALSLAGYAVAFTIAYTRIGAGVGALLLFGAVQITMISVGIARGERPLGRDWLGLTLAMAGLIWLTVPGATAPDLTGSVLMLAAGACWGAYSLAGRASKDPLASTSGNFWRGAILTVAALAFLVDFSRVTPTGIWLATASGALASGVGYTIWYTALPALGAWRGALVQLTVPIITGVGAALFLGEAITARLTLAAALVTGGVWLSLQASRKRA